MEVFVGVRWSEEQRGMPEKVEEEWAELRRLKYSILASDEGQNKDIDKRIVAGDNALRDFLTVMRQRLLLGWRKLLLLKGVIRVVGDSR